MRRLDIQRPLVIKDALMKLEVLKSVRAELGPVVDVAVTVVRAAEQEMIGSEARAQRAEERARLAEETIAEIRPHLAQVGEECDRLQSEVDAQRDIAESERVERSQRVDVVKTVGAINELAAATEALEVAQRSAMRDTVDLLKAIHACTLGPHGKSAVQDFTKRGPWSVTDVDGAVIETFSSRAEAVQLVKRLYDEEKSAQAEPAHDAMPDDGPDSPKRRRKPQPGQEHDGYPPPAPAAVDHGVSKRRKDPRIL